MRNEIIWLFLGMMAVTYIPRALPSILAEKIRLTPKVGKFLKLIPYTAMAALIFPAVITVDPERIYIGISGAAAALLSSFAKLPVIVTVIAAIACDFIIYILV